MSHDVILSVPHELAEALIEERVVVQSFQARSGLASAVHWTLTIVGDGADVVTVVTAVVTVSKLARRLAAHLHKRVRSGQELVIRVGTTETRIDIASQSEDELVHQIEQLLHEGFEADANGGANRTDAAD